MRGGIVFALPIVLALTSLAGTSAYLYAGEPTVFTAKGQEAKDLLASLNVPTFINLFSSKCLVSRKASRKIIEASKLLDGMVRFVAVDCDKDDNDEVCKEIAQGFLPRFLFYVPGQKPAELRFDPTPEMISTFTFGNLPDFVVELQSKHARQFLQTKPEMPKLLVVSRTISYDEQLQYLAYRGLGRLAVGFVSNPSPELRQLAKISSAKEPAGLVFTTAGSTTPQAKPFNGTSLEIFNLAGEVALPEPIDFEDPEAYYAPFRKALVPLNTTRITAADIEKLEDDRTGVPKTVMFCHFWHPACRSYERHLSRHVHAVEEKTGSKWFVFDLASEEGFDVSERFEINAFPVITSFGGKDPVKADPKPPQANKLDELVQYTLWAKDQLETQKTGGRPSGKNAQADGQKGRGQPRTVTVDFDNKDEEGQPSIKMEDL